MMPLSRISVQLSVEPLIDCPLGLQLPERLNHYECTFTQLQGVSNMIVSIGQFTLSLHYGIKCVLRMFIIDRS